MPIFDFGCSHCGHKFERMISNEEKKNICCPQCGTPEIKQLLSVFNTGSRGEKNAFPCQAACSGNGCKFGL